jgi:cytochrome c oxidase subunit 2
MSAATGEVSAANPVEAPGVVDGLSQWNLPEGVTATSQQIYGMHMMVTWVSVVVCILVFAAVIWTIVRYRRSQGAVAAGWSSHLGLEILWTLVPALVLIGMAIPTTGVLLAINRPGSPMVTVRVTGSQWKWHYAYADLGIGFYSNLKDDSWEASRKGSDRPPRSVPNYLKDVDRPLVLPTGQDVQLQIASDDVIHSWWVPELGFKRDAIPGFINLMDFVIERPGLYRGQCGELCGARHAYMPIVVEAVAPEEFQNWAAAQRQRQAQERSESAARPWTLDEAMAQGQIAYEALCAACHQKDGTGIPGVFPALKGSKVATGPMADHIRFVVHGSQKNPVMRAFGKEIDDRQLAGLITYERNAWGNSTGDLVTSEQVGAAR